jgi:hypothetical protein
MAIVNDSVWRDFSERERLEWLRAQAIHLSSAVDGLARRVDEIGNAVKNIEENLRSQK